MIIAKVEFIRKYGEDTEEGIAFLRLTPKDAPDISAISFVVTPSGDKIMPWHISHFVVLYEPIAL